MYNIKLFLKSTLRKPLFVIIYIFLIAVSGMAFTSNALETLFAVKSIDAIKKYYRPIGYLSGNPDAREGKEIISKSQYLELENIKLFSRGKLKDIENPDVDGPQLKNAFYKHTQEVVFSGVLTGKNKVNNPKGKGYYYDLQFEVANIDAAYKDYMSIGDSVDILSLPGVEDTTTDITYYPTEQDANFVKEYKALNEGKSYIIRAYYYELNNVNGLGAAQRGHAGSNFVILPLIPDENTGYFQEVKNNTDYQGEMQQKLKDYVEYLNYNRKMLSVIGMKDVSLFPTFQEKAKRYYIVEGRALNAEDDRTKNKVCLIHENFAKLRGLGVGDTIKMELKKNTNAEDASGYSMLEDWDIWKNSPGEETEFEIVGIYNDMGLYYISPYGVYVYVPASCVSGDYSTNYLKENSENNYSFVLKNPEDIDSFTRENEKKLNELGYTIMWVDNSAEMFLGVSNKIKESAVTGTVLSGLLMIAVLSAVCIIYVNQRKKEYAVAKALGAKTGFSFFCMDTAFCVIAIPGIIAGSIIGQRKMLKDSVVLLKPLQEYAKGIKLSAPQTIWLVLIMLCILALIILILIICNMVLGKIPVFSLLHGNRKKNTAYKANTSTQSISGMKADLNKNTALSSPVNKGQKIIYAGSGKSVRWKYGYIFKHIIRTKAKTVFFIAMSAGAVLFFGWLNSTLDKYKADIESFYNSTVIEGELIRTDPNISFTGNSAEGVIPPKLVSDLDKTDYMSEIYTEESALLNEIHMTEGGYVDDSIPPMCKDSLAVGVTDWEKFIEQTGSGLSVEFYGGYNGKYFTRDREAGNEKAHEIILPLHYMKLHRLGVGDLVYIVHEFSSNNSSKGISYRIVGSYEIDEKKQTLKGIGDAVIFQSQSLKDLVNQDYRFLTARFKFKTEKNRELIKDKSKLTNLVTENGADSYLRLIIWDRELSEVVEPMERVVSLFEVLYPFIILIVVIIGAGFQILMLMRRKKEATLMRLLGSSKREVWQIMFAGHLLLCVLGIPAGIVILFSIYKNMAFSVLLVTGLYFVGNVAGGVIGSFLILKSFKLELLQESE